MSPGVDGHGRADGGPTASTSAPNASATNPSWPKRFLKGTGMSVWQNSGDEHSQWTSFVRRKNYLGQPKYQDAFATSNDFWNLYEQDIALAAGLGATSFRFSFEWARFEPTRSGLVDQGAVQRYHAIIDCIRSHGMEPMSTLHHFTHPQWFEAMGGFTTEANIPPFLDYCRFVFQEFRGSVTFWATFNEPTCFAFVGYIMGMWAPGGKFGFTRCGEVLLVLLKAHVAVYKMLKAEPGGDRALIGLVHQHIKFVPKTSLPWVNLVCHWMTHFFALKVILRFFQTGIYEWKAPFQGITVSYTDLTAPKALDWWGINYYSSPCLDWKFRLGASHANEHESDIGFRCYPQGLYDAIVDASTLGVPLFVTETGLADKHDRYRDVYIRSHYAAVLRALRDGYDVRGMFFWTLMDNIEWHEGFHVKYGLYEWDPVIRRSRPLRLKAGAEVLRDEVHAVWPDTFDELRQYANAEAAEAGASLIGTKAPLLGVTVVPPNNMPIRIVDNSSTSSTPATTRPPSSLPSSQAETVIIRANGSSTNASISLPYSAAPNTAPYYPPQQSAPSGAASYGMALHGFNSCIGGNNYSSIGNNYSNGSSAFGMAGSNFTHTNGSSAMGMAGNVVTHSNGQSGSAGVNVTNSSNSVNGRRPKRKSLLNHNVNWQYQPGMVATGGDGSSGNRSSGSPHHPHTVAPSDLTFRFDSLETAHDSDESLGTPQEAPNYMRSLLRGDQQRPHLPTPPANYVHARGYL